MGAKTELFVEAKQIRTSIPILCIACLRERILNWSEDYAQWVCDKCLAHLPANKKTITFKRMKAKLYNRKLSLRDTPKWIKEQDLN